MTRIGRAVPVQVSFWSALLNVKYFLLPVEGHLVDVVLPPVATEPALLLEAGPWWNVATVGTNRS